jgi:hypothetical protein
MEEARRSSVARDLPPCRGVAVHLLLPPFVLRTRAFVRPPRLAETAPLWDEGMLSARRRSCIRDVLDNWSRRLADERQLRHARHDRLRTSGALGGLARGLAEAVSGQERRRVPERKGANLEYPTRNQRATDPPVVTASRWTRGRSQVYHRPRD